MKFSVQQDSGFDKFLMYVPIIAAVIFGYFGWMSLGLSHLVSYVPEKEREIWNEYLDWGVPFAEFLALIHFSFVFRICKLVPRYLQIVEMDADRYVNMALVLKGIGIFLIVGDAMIVHVGMEWLLEQSGKSLPSLIVFAFSLALSIYNMGAEWVFSSPLMAKVDRLKLEAESDAAMKAAQAILEDRPDWGKLQSELLEGVNALNRELEEA